MWVWQLETACCSASTAAQVGACWLHVGGTACNACSACMWGLGAWVAGVVCPDCYARMQLEQRVLPTHLPAPADVEVPDGEVCFVAQKSILAKLS